MDKNALSRVVDLAGSDGAPQASILTPDVRSGASFTYSGSGTEFATPFLVIWFYTVETTKRKQFVDGVNTLETSNALPQGANGIFYRGTYSVSISAVAPDLEFRTLWGLEGLATLQNLNDLLRSPPAQLKDVLDLIPAVPAMRSEIMGRTSNSVPLTSRN